ncbi:MAG TPA: EAL domain-containing protein [Nitrospiria bacterium]|nr:EAL domain-containing protein [Nitrospiria bacterium]
MFKPGRGEVLARLSMTVFLLAVLLPYALRAGKVKLNGNKENECLDEGRTRQIIERIREVFFLLDSEKKEPIHVSPGYLETWGRAPEELCGSSRSWIDDVYPEDRDRVFDLTKAKKSSDEYEQEYRIVRPDGTMRWIHDRTFPVQDSSGEVCMIGKIATDITDQRRMESELEESKAHLAGIISITAEAIIMIDESQRIMLFNKGAEEIFGYEASEVVGKPLDLLLPVRFAAVHRDEIRSFGVSPEQARLMGKRRAEIYGRRKDGTEFSADASIGKWSRGGQMMYVAILRDISDRKRSEETIHRLAFYDSLTGLPNRISFRDLLQRTILEGKFNGRPVATLLMDIDRFKEINDTLGHERGDLLLRHVGSRLKDVLRSSDTIARLGGDEFGLVLPVGSSNDAVSVARKILIALDDPFEIEGLPIAVESSIGISLYPDHGANAESLIQRADVAMYISKRRKNGFTVYNPEHDLHSPRRLALLGELRHGIESAQLFLLYEPKIHLITGRVTGVEALVRWQHPQLGLMLPDQFIFPAEQTALIKPLTVFVLNEAIRQCRAWHQQGQKIPVAVNLSVRNLQDPSLPNQIGEILQANEVAPSDLELEITESSIMADPEMAMNTVEDLSKMGIRLAIDDFGVGYSSLGYLKKLKVNSLKVDRSFVKDVPYNNDDVSIVRSTIDLAHNLGLEVIAEGVDSKKGLKKLISLGCDQAQGYYISHPISPSELVRRLNEFPGILA